MGAVVKKIKKGWEYGYGRTALASVCAHSVSISVGICQGYSAILIPQLTQSSEFDVTDEESSWLASLGAITNPLGSILSGVLAEYLGRKISIQISSIPFIIGWISIAMADNIWWLYAGRLITGIAAGMSTACYAYVAEISGPTNRGLFQALGPVLASFGILFTYTLGYVVHWSWVALLSTSFALFTLVGIHLVPESPAHLIRNNQRDRGFASLLWFRRSIAVAQEEYVQLTLKEDEERAQTTKAIYLSPVTVKPFIVLVTVFFLQEMSGIYTILFYAVNFFQDSNLEIDEHVSSIIVGLIRFVMSIIGAVLINRCARRSLLMASAAGMAVTMLVAASYFKFYEMHAGETRRFTFLPLMCVLFNVFFSMVGMLPIPWILVGELFPLHVRSIVGGFVICLAQCFIFVCVKIYHDMTVFLGFSGILYVFFLASVLACVFCFAFVPETRNKSLDEIEQYFRGEKPERNFDGVDNRGFVAVETPTTTGHF